MRYLQLLLIFATISAACFGQTPTAPVPNSYFGMGIHSSSVWPSGFNPGSVRVWDTNAQWLNTETASGTYNWTTLDATVALAQSHSASVLYDLGGTPAWGSSTPAGTCSENTGSCYPPSDLTLTGSTWSSPIWSAWVTAVTHRYCGTIVLYELWNEPDLTGFWTGTVAQLAGLAQIAYPIVHSTANCSVGGVNPNSLLTPGFGSDTPTAFIISYTNVGAIYADSVAFHNYIPVATNFYGPFSTFSSYFQGVSFATGKSPLFYNTESGFGRNSGFPYLSYRMAWLGQDYLIGWPDGVQARYWYQYDNSLWGTMYSASGIETAAYNSGGSTCNVGDVVNVMQSGGSSGSLIVSTLGPITLTVSTLGVGYSTATGLSTTSGIGVGCGSSLVVNITAGATTNLLSTAYAQVQKWMVGATDSCTRSCDQAYVCKLTRTSPIGYVGYAIWHANGAATYTVPTGIVQYRDLYGNLTSTTPGTVISLPASTSPLLFETASAW